MSDQNATYAISEVVGTSDQGINEAIENAIATASKSLRNLDWFEVISMRGAIANSKVSQYQVSLKLGFRYED